MLFSSGLRTEGDFVPAREKIHLRPDRARLCPAVPGGAGGGRDDGGSGRAQGWRQPPIPARHIPAVRPAPGGGARRQVRLLFREGEGGWAGGGTGRQVQLA